MTAIYYSTIRGFQHKGLGWESWPEGDRVRQHATCDEAKAVLTEAKAEWPERGEFAIENSEGYSEIYEWRRGGKPARVG